MPSPNRTYKDSKKKVPRSKSKKTRQSAFLAAFTECASITKASKKSKVPRRTVYEWFKEDPEFTTQFKEAEIAALGVLEDEAVRRAYEGVQRPVFQGGKLAGKVKEYSDTLLVVLLKARAPEKYKDRVANEHTGKNGKPISIDSRLQIEIVPPNDED